MRDDGWDDDLVGELDIERVFVAMLSEASASPVGSTSTHDKVAELLGDIMFAHRNPEDPQYNECEKEGKFTCSLLKPLNLSASI